jgi:hypothetical protein
VCLEGQWKLHRVVWNAVQERGRLVITKGKREEYTENLGGVNERPPKEGMLVNNPLLEEGDRVILWESEKKMVTH